MENVLCAENGAHTGHIFQPARARENDLICESECGSENWQGEKFHVLVCVRVCVENSLFSLVMSNDSVHLLVNYVGFPIETGGKKQSLAFY